MSDTHISTGSATPENTITLGMADWLCLAAAPTFAVMALLSCMQGSDAAMLCMGGSPLTGMAAMYLLMSAFHLAPWLRVISGRQIR
ncbi:hypothetical protein [Mesorhizobium carmichaelinearum]|uniref:hypothetical protein n=1 Tax=Mesorhizobium carmichaelinearum TaxID=1208188 RepID=UPI000BA4932C|nr:hypothetical protein [Mesorhizobium carmichaelinearum]